MNEIIIFVCPPVCRLYYEGYLTSEEKKIRLNQNIWPFFVKIHHTIMHLVFKILCPFVCHYGSKRGCLVSFSTFCFATYGRTRFSQFQIFVLGTLTFFFKFKILSSRKSILLCSNLRHFQSFSRLFLFIYLSKYL